MIAREAPGLLRDYADLGLLEPADVHVARALGRLGNEHDHVVLLAVALAVRAVRLGSVCVDLSEPSVVEQVAERPSVETNALRVPTDLLARVAASPLVTGEAPLHLEGSLLYLDRYWRQERLIADSVDARRARPPADVDETRLAVALARLFDEDADPLQGKAAEIAARRWLTIVAGGPGTGKTTTVARMLAVLADLDGRPPRIALAAPTGKAAARLEESVRNEVAKLEPADRERLGTLRASTIHRLLGWKPGARSRFLHDRDHPLPFDVVVLDEASMVSLTMMARLIEAVPFAARLVMVGDPGQLASVEAGSVLGDLVRRTARGETGGAVAAVDGVVTLTTVHRTDNVEITDLAAAITAGDADAVVSLLTEGKTVQLVPSGDAAIRHDVLSSGSALVEAAEAGDVSAALAALNRHRVLCAHLTGPHGVADWGKRIETWLVGVVPEVREEWYVGRPLLVTSNDAVLGLFNGDTGVVVHHDGRMQAAFPGPEGPRLIATNRLGEVATVHAMSVHKSQGSEFDAVTLVLPDIGSPLLTRELFYTGVTRAKQRVRVVGSEAAVRAAVSTRIHRASGL